MLIFAQAAGDAERFIDKYGWLGFFALLAVLALWRIGAHLAKRHIESLDRRDAAFELQTPLLANLVKSQQETHEAVRELRDNLPACQYPKERERHILPYGQRP